MDGCGAIGEARPMPALRGSLAIWAARLALVAAAAAAAYAGAGLVRTLGAPEPAAVRQEPGPPTADGVASGAPADAAGWQPIFGAPETAPPPAPAAPAAAVPYVLKGLFATDGSRWAILAGPSWDGVVQVGDTLPSGERVAGIDAGGVQLEAKGRQRRIAFDASAPVAVGRSEVSVAGEKAQAAEVRSQGIAPDDLREMLDRARRLRERRRPATE